MLGFIEEVAMDVGIASLHKLQQEPLTAVDELDQNEPFVDIDADEDDHRLMERRPLARVHTY